MRHWRICAIGQTEVLLHPAVFAYLVYGKITGHFRFMLLAFVSILVHEIAHVLSAAALGQPPASLEITPIGAVMRLEDETKLPPLRRLLMILSGPLLSFLLCYAALEGVSHHWLNQQIGRELFLANTAILLMNMLPVLPLDGGRLLALGAGMYLSPMTVKKLLRLISRIVGLSLIILNIASAVRYGGWNLSLAFAGCCILYSASMCHVTHAMTELRFFLDRKIKLERKGMLRTVIYTALHTIPIRRLIRQLPPGKECMFVCLEAGSAHTLGTIHESELIQRYLEEPTSSFGDAIRKQKAQFDFAKSDTI